MKYSITLASFRKIEPIELTLDRLDGQGYDAVEMYGEPELEKSIEQLKDVLSTSAFPVCGITGMWGRASVDGWKRKLLSTDKGIAAFSEKYVRDCIRICRDFGGKEINICLFGDDDAGFDGNHWTKLQEEKIRILEKAVPILKKLCREAADNGVRLALEPLNRYSTPFCTTAADALLVAHQVEGLGILLDTFHMNIEEGSIRDAIVSCRDLLLHTHFADNNRSMPGFAHIDFDFIMRALNEIGYAGYVSFEPNIGDRNYEQHIKAGLDYIKRLEHRLQHMA